MTTRSMTLGVDGALKPIFDMTGVACLLISLAWLAQMATFTGSDIAVVRFEWTILSAFVAGIGIGCFLASHYWMAQPQLQTVERLRR